MWGRRTRGGLWIGSAFVDGLVRWSVLGLSRLLLIDAATQKCAGFVVCSLRGGVVGGCW